MDVSSNSRIKRFIDVVTACSAVLTVLLGFWGYARVGGGDFFDWLYSALGLLTLGGGDIKGDPLLQFARWTGALCVFSVIVQLVVPRVHDRVTRTLARSMRGHRVVIGLGDKGRAVVSLGAQGDGDRPQPMVAIDVDEAKVDDRRIERPGLRLLRGDARVVDELRTAAVHRAESVVIATESDARNLEIAKLVADEATSRRVDAATLGARADPLRVFVHIGDPGLRRELRAYTAKTEDMRALLRPFALPSVAARLLLTTHPLAVAAREHGQPRINVAFVGFDAYAEEVLMHLLRLGPLDGQDAPSATVFAPDADAIRRRLERDVPAAFEIAGWLHFRALDPHGDLAAEELAAAEPADAPLTACFVHAADDHACFAAAVRTRRAAQRHARWKAPVFMRVGDATPFRRVLDAQFSGKRAEQTIEPFGELLPTLDAMLDGEWSELLAQSLHRSYRDMQGETVDGRRRYAVTPTEKAWCGLDEEARESNRRAVEHFPLKLASIGRIVRASPFVIDRALGLDDAAIDRLARMEHDSWCREKRLAGWRHAAVRDNQRRMHPDLVPFDALRPDVREKDREQVRSVEQHLLAPIDPRYAAMVDDARAHSGPNVFRERVIGLAGHLRLDLAQAKRVAAAVGDTLAKMAAEERLGPLGEEFWTFVTPLAPGGDVVLAKAALAWLAERPQLKKPRRYRLLVVQEVPLPVLASAWREAGPLAHHTPDGTRAFSHRSFAGRHPSETDGELTKVLDAFIAEHPEIERFIDLSPPGTLPSAYATAEARDAAFDRTNDYLVRRCDDLIALVDPTRYGFTTLDPAQWREASEDRLPPPGMGALVRAWLRDRDRARVSAVEPLGDDGLHWIDPGPAASGVEAGGADAGALASTATQPAA